MTATLDENVAELRRANTELRQRLDEALARESATAEVLGVINSSPGDLAPVFDAILERAHTLCGAVHGHLTIYDGQHFRAVATHGVPEQFARLLRQPFRPGADLAERLLGGEGIFHIPDMAALILAPEDQIGRAAVELGGARTLLAVPLRKDDALLGYITAHRQEVRPFTEKEIALLQNFAAQAVIAIENTRLITETREALDQQTATAEVLGVINSSPGNLTPVFNAILEKAHSLCGAAYGSLQLYDGDRFRAVALRDVSEAMAERLRQGYSPGPNMPDRRLVEGDRFAQVSDMYEIDVPVARAGAEADGARTVLFVALRKDDVLLGQIVAARREVRPFSDKQIALLQNFAAQAVIAIENARLLGNLRERTDDLQESLEYQTATSDVLKVISRSTFDLQPVLDTLAETAARLCDAGYTAIFRRDGEVYRIATVVAFSPETMEAALKFQAFLEQHPLVPGRGSIVGRVALEGRAVHVADTASDPEYILGEAKTLGNIRTQLGVPLLREGEPIGVIILARQRVQPFTEGQIELVRIFADQAVIALENARLLGELRERTDDLQEVARIPDRDQ
jgi:GAF domain-containing protein